MCSADRLCLDDHAGTECDEPLGHWNLEGAGREFLAATLEPAVRSAPVHQKGRCGKPIRIGPSAAADRLLG